MTIRRWIPPRLLGARSKYGNERTPALPGVRSFHSGAEAKRAAQLAMLERVGEIRDLAYQVPFELSVNGVLVARYIADFVYEERDRTSGRWVRIVEDHKGPRTERFRMKQRLMLACHGIELRITGKEPGWRSRRKSS